MYTQDCVTLDETFQIHLLACSGAVAPCQHDQENMDARPVQGEIIRKQKQFRSVVKGLLRIFLFAPSYISFS